MKEQVNTQIEGRAVEGQRPENRSKTVENQPGVSQGEGRPSRPFLYRFRGVILSILAVAVLIFPPSELSLVPFLIFVNLFIIAAYLRMRARCSIGDHSRSNVQMAPVLVTWGAYARLRHPLYLSNTVVALSLIVLHLGLSVRVLPFAAFMIGFCYALSKLDDRYLESRYGDEWRRWAEKTPAFIPSENHLRGPMRSGREALKADMYTWIWLALIVGLVLFRKVDFLIW